MYDFYLLLDTHVVDLISPNSLLNMAVSELKFKHGLLVKSERSITCMMYSILFSASAGLREAFLVQGKYSLVYTQFVPDIGGNR